MLYGTFYRQQHDICYLSQAVAGEASTEFPRLCFFVTLWAGLRENGCSYRLSSWNF